MGKVIGGGFTVGAFGGRADIMSAIAPLGPVYQAGTLSGNPVAMAAGLATLDLVSKSHFYSNLTLQTEKLVKGLAARAQAAGLLFSTTSIGGMFGLFFNDVASIQSEADVKQSNVELFKQFFHGMLNKGIYFAPSAFESGFVSAAHGDHEINQTFIAAEEVLG